MPNIFYGIRRLLLLNTANYSLGDFPLDRPLSISAPNNRGKSTAINALQFPFLSDMKDMSFPQNNDNTRKYYFPYDSSYIVSEIVTETGTYVVGTAGKGQASGYDYQLFAYKAELNLDDFLSGNSETKDREVRNLKQLQTRLSKRNIWIKQLSPKQMRDALMGSQVTLANNEKFTIGVFRLRARTEANSRLFFRIFKNLLHMNNVNIEEMKRLLLDALLPAESSATVDIMARYKILTEDVDSIKAKADTAAQIADNVAQLAMAKETLDLSYGILRKLFTPIGKKYTTEINQYKEKISTTQKALDSITPRKTKLIESQEPLHKALGKYAVQTSELEKKINTIITGKDTFALFPSVEQQQNHIQSLQAKRDQLIGELQRTQPGDSTEIEAERRSVTTQTKELRNRLSVINNNLLTILTDHFSKTDIQLILKLFNKDVLTSLPIGENGVQVIDRKKLVATISTALHQCTDGYYKDDRLRINLQEIFSVNIDDYFSRELILEEMERLQKRTSTLERNLEISKNYNELEKEKDSLSSDIRKEEDNLKAYQTFLQEQEKEKDYKKALLTAKTGEKQASDDLKEITGQLDKLKEEEQTLQTAKKVISQDIETLKDKYRKIVPPSNTDPPGKTPAYHMPADLHDMFEKYFTALEDKHLAREQITRNLQLIESKNGLRFTSGNDENTTILELIDAVKGQKEYITQQRNAQRATSQEMGALLKGLTSRFDSFIVALRKFNRKVSSHPISNIKRIEFVVDESNEILRTIRNIVEQGTMFTDLKKVDSAIKQLGELITRKNVKLSLQNLFNLGIEVELANGDISTSFNDANIQSTGTGITVKVILNVVLLNRLLHTPKGQIITIPVYIDEAGQIDQANQQTLIDQCKPTGFVPVFASVEPQATADYWITLTETDDHIYVAQDDWFHLSKRDKTATGAVHA